MAPLWRGRLDLKTASRLGFRSPIKHCWRNCKQLGALLTSSPPDHLPNHSSPVGQRPRLKLLAAGGLMKGVESRGRPQKPLEPALSHLVRGQCLRSIWVSVRWPRSPSHPTPVERGNAFGDSEDAPLAIPETLRQPLRPHHRRQPLLSTPQRGAEVLSTPAGGSESCLRRWWRTEPARPAVAPGRESAAAAETCSFQGALPASQGCKLLLQAIEEPHHQKVHHLLQ